MRRAIAMLGSLAVLCLAREAGAQARSAAALPSEDHGFFSGYANYFDRKLDQLVKKPIWGLTSQLPEGVLKFRYEFSPAQADAFFDADGNVVPLLPPIEFTDFPAKGDRLVINPHVTGGGEQHSFQIGYGITDTINAFVEMPFTSISTELELEVTKNGQPLNQLERAVLETYITSNGRPMPNTSFEGDMDLGDVRLGGSWNYTRTEHVSAAVTPSVYFPTGTQAEPNNDLSYLLGPEIDRGTGAWSINFTNTFDLRPVEWIIFNLELSTTYRFAYDRKSPKWLPITECARIADPNRRSAIPAGQISPLCSPASPPYDRAYDLEQSTTFPDLSGLDSTYHIEPGLAWSVGTGFILELTPIPVQFAYNFNRQEAPTIRATGAGDSGFAFQTLVDSLALFEATELHTIGVGIALPLFPLYVPITVTPSAKWAVAGKNQIKLESQFSVAFELFLPVGDIWMEPEKDGSAEPASSSTQQSARQAATRSLAMH